MKISTKRTEAWAYFMPHTLKGQSSSLNVSWFTLICATNAKQNPAAANRTKHTGGLGF